MGCTRRRGGHSQARNRPSSFLSRALATAASAGRTSRSGFPPEAAAPARPRLMGSLSRPSPGGPRLTPGRSGVLLNLIMKSPRDAAPTPAPSQLVLMINEAQFRGGFHRPLVSSYSGLSCACYTCTSQLDEDEDTQNTYIQRVDSQHILNHFVDPVPSGWRWLLDAHLLL